MAYQPLTDDELKNMHEKLKNQFKRAAGAVDVMENDDFFPYSNIRPIISVMATSATALVAIERELRDRSKREDVIVPQKNRP